MTLPDNKYECQCTNQHKQQTKTHWDCNKTRWTVWRKNGVYVFCCTFSSFLSFEHKEMHYWNFLGFKKKSTYLLYCFKKKDLKKNEPSLIMWLSLKSGFKKRRYILLFKKWSISLRTSPQKIYDCRMKSVFPEFDILLHVDV